MRQRGYADRVLVLDEAQAFDERTDSRTLASDSALGLVSDVKLLGCCDEFELFVCLF